MKQYLASSPLLARTMKEEDLFVYLAVSKVAISAVLIKEEGKVQRPVFYINRILKEEEVRYLSLEKLVLALVIASRRLKPYFLKPTPFVS